MFEEPADTAVDAILERPEGSIVQDGLCLCNVIVASHGGDDGALLGEGGRLANDAKEDFRGSAHHDASFAGHGPDARGGSIAAGGSPDGTGKVPKVDGGVVGDEEGLSVDFFVVEGNGRGSRGGEEKASGEKVGVSNVADVGKVKQVHVVAQLDLGLAAAVGLEEASEGLHVAFAKDACGTDGRGEELGGFGAVGVEDEFFSGSLIC